MTIGPAYGAGGADRARMLASSDDRDRAVDFLKTAFAEGRLSAEEYDARMSRGLAARTYADLDALMVDLPGGRPPGTNPLAITAMVCGIAQFFGFWLLCTIPAIVCGHIARRQIRRTGEQGEGMAMAGLVMGWIGAALSVVAVVALVLLIAAFAHSAAHPVPLPHPPGG